MNQERDRSGIYQIKNLATGKIYLGSAVNLRKRWNLHTTHLRAGSHHSIKLQNSWAKHGAQSFVFEVVEYVDDLNVLVAREQHWLDRFVPHQTGYNICAVAGNVLGVKRSDETKEKIRAANAGKKATPETLERMRAAMLGKSHAGGAKISQALKGRAKSNEHKRKIAESKTGRKRGVFSEEWRANLSKSKKGVVKSAEWIANIKAGKARAKAERERIAANESV